jgi:hypothetical protein
MTMPANSSHSSVRSECGYVSSLITIAACYWFEFWEVFSSVICVQILDSLVQISLNKAVNSTSALIIEGLLSNHLVSYIVIIAVRGQNLFVLLEKRNWNWGQNNTLHNALLLYCTRAEHGQILNLWAQDIFHNWIYFEYIECVLSILKC